MKKNQTNRSVSGIIKIEICANICTIIVNGCDVVQFVVLKLNATVTTIMHNIIDALQLLLFSCEPQC